MAVALPILLYVSAGLAAYSAVKQGQAASAAATFNAIAGKQDEAAARADALAQSIQVQRENVLRLGSIRAAAGAGGGTPEGSVLDLVADVAAQGELERQFVIFQGENRARGFRNTATLDVAQGRAAADEGLIRGAGAALGGFGSATQSSGRLRRT